MLNIESWDDRRDYLIAGNTEETVAFAATHWIHSAQRAIQQKGRFAVALSGGSTPKAIYEELIRLESANRSIDWTKVWLFWSDERAVPPNDPESNYAMAMQSGFSQLPIPPNQIFRMQAETEIEKQARDYEEKIAHYVGSHGFDLVMLGVGEDGHTASLFPNTSALNIEDRWVAANEIPQKKTRRMTLTFPGINQSQHAAFYAIGPSKRAIVPKVLQAAILSPFPASRIGTPQHKALWILDQEAGALLSKKSAK